MAGAIESAIIRNRATDKRVVGVGFLVGQRHVLTCAHGIDDASGQGCDISDQPSDCEVHRQNNGDEVTGKDCYEL